MFKERIGETVFTSGEARLVFAETIDGANFDDDCSFKSTLRAMLGKRVAVGESLTLSVNRGAFNKDTDLARITNGMRLSGDGYFCIFHCTNYDELEAMEMLDSVDSRFMRVFKGYEKVGKITDYYRQPEHKAQFKVLCFINRELKSVALFTSNLDSLKKWHYLQQCIVPAMPWYFDGDMPVNETEMRLLASLKEKTSDSYLSCLEDIASAYNFRSMKIHRLLDGFESKGDKLRLGEVERSIRDQDSVLQDYRDRLAQLLSKREKTLIERLGLEQRILVGSSSNGMMEYFECSKNLELDEAGDQSCVFSTSGYFTYFDTEMAERIIGKESSFVYYNSDGELYTKIEPKRMAKLLTSVFVDEVLKVKVCAGYKMIIGQQVLAMSNYRFPYKFNDYMPNPHINRHQCLGNYETVLNSLMCEHDYIGAVEQCSASCMSLNWADSVPMRDFVYRMYHDDKKYVVLPDGSSVKPIEAIEWLEKQEETEMGASEDVTEVAENETEEGVVGEEAETELEEAIDE